ncbi:MAG: dTDP-glucose 4,6-dehydratase [Candidatus Dojkabacteria bacterium]|nr:MAG: dTDP-glucose 4,6-dehydratase [Candidatus Dojkabacteria bacterium]
MNILVTGGAGFIGSNFVHYWIEKYPSDNLVVFDKLTYAGNLENIKEVLRDSRPNGAIFVKGDICNRDLLEKTLKDFEIDSIVHFAAESHVDRSIEAPDDFIQTNIIGTFNILELLKKYPHIRLHHVSTDEVYGDLPLDKPEVKFTENSKYSPSSPYSASKAASDHLVRAYVRTYGIKATISNCSNNFGPFCFPEKLIPLVITRALYNQEIPVYGTGEQVRDWIHTRDHVYGIDLILRKGKLGETYLLGGNGERQNIWVVRKILEILGKPENLIVHVGDRKGHDQRYAIDYSKARKDLGFEPLKNFEERLKETIEWYKNNEDWWKESKKKADIIAEKYLAQRL